MNKTDKFVSKAVKVHNNKYLYRYVNYTRAEDKIVITCNIHGDFLQTPNSHLNGSGCPKCAADTRVAKRTKSVNWFLQQAYIVHKNKYDYTSIVYKGTKTKIQIGCPTHGVFTQSPADHLQGKGCVRCGREVTANKQCGNKEDFTAQATIKHKAKFDYSNVVYKTAKVKVEIVCPVHGTFWQTPDTHLRSTYGCIKCGHTTCAYNARSHTEAFIVKAKKKHGTNFDYSKVTYTTARTPIDLVCNRCGTSVMVAPYAHLASSSCPVCDSRGFDKTKPGSLYYLSINNGEAYKIGVTNYTVAERYSKEELVKIKVLKVWEFAIGKDAYIAEQYYLKEYKYAKYEGSALLRSGNTELFNQDVLLLDVPDCM